MVHLIRVTTIEDHQFDPAMVRQILDSDNKPMNDDTVIALFESLNGSIYGDEVFSSLANLDVGYHFIVRPDDA